jgi:uncharacterized protein
VALCHHDPVGVTVWAGLAAALVFASTVQAVTGFGFALLAMPLLSLAVGAKDAVAVSSIVGALGSTVLFARTRRDVRWPLVGPLLGGAVLGMPIGLAVLLTVDDDVLKAAIAVTVLVFVVILQRGWSLEGAGRRVDVVAGFVSGVLNTSVSTNGPPLVLTLHARNLPPEAFRGTISAVFACSAVVANVLLASAGRYTPTVLAYAALGPPALLVGSFLGARIGRHVPAQRFRSLVLGLLVLAASASLVSALTG